MLVTATSPVGVVPSSLQLVDNLADRRACAYRIGEAKTRRRLISADAYLFLYKELVNLCGGRSYCWPGLDYLARILETSEGTIKRWMRELEAAHLIRRKPRPGGQTSLTYITAFLACEPERVSKASADTADVSQPWDLTARTSDSANEDPQCERNEVRRGEGAAALMALHERFQVAKAALWKELVTCRDLLDAHDGGTGDCQ